MARTRFADRLRWCRNSSCRQKRSSSYFFSRCAFTAGFFRCEPGIDLGAVFGAHAVGRSQIRKFHDHQGGDESLQARSEEHTSELQSRVDLVCRLLLEKKKIEK